MQSAILKRLNRERALGRPAALVTILSTRGSSPRKAGSQMLVFEDGSIFGSIGGGLAEGRSIRAAAEALKTGRSSGLEMTMNASVAADEGMACGGEMEIFVQYVAAPGPDPGETGNSRGGPEALTARPGTSGTVPPPHE